MKGGVTVVGIRSARGLSSVSFSSISVLLGVAALVTALAIRPPAIAWVGFGVISIVAVGLGFVSVVAFPQMRASLQAPLIAADGQRRLLVIADASCNEAVLCNAIANHLDGAVEVHLVVPVRVSRLHYLMDDEADERWDARKSMLSSVRLLQGRGIPATGSVGGDDPLEAVGDALAWFPATEVLLALPPAEDSYWLEAGLVARERALTPVAVTEVIVPADAGSDGRANAGVAR